MQHYRAYIIGDDGHIEGAIDLHCENEQAAKERAEQLVDDHAIELWQGARQIAVFESPSSCEGIARQVAQEYADDQRAVIENLQRKLS